MNKSAPRLPAPDTRPYLLLALTALSGEYPASQVRRLPGGGAYNESVVKALKRENLLKTYYRDGVRGLRLTTAAKRLLLDERPDHFTPYLTGSNETNLLKSEVNRRLRLHRMAEVMVMMHNAEVAVFPWEKPPLFQSNPAQNSEVPFPAYYSSREVKEIGLERQKITSSRMTGVLLTDNELMAVYNTGPGLIKWENRSELRLRIFLEMDLSYPLYGRKLSKAEIGGLIFGEEMDLMPKLMRPGSGKRTPSILEDSFQHFYFLPNDHRGEIMLRLLCNEDLKEVLDDALIEGNYTREGDDLGWGCDAFDENGDPVLFVYTGDMCAIERFNKYLKVRDETGTLICFDFQKEAIRQVCGPHINISLINFDACEEFLGEIEWEEY